MPRFVPRQRKHKVLARQKETSKGASSPATTPASSNQEILIPQSKAERQAKKEALLAELRAQQTKVSSKKQKRLDKYVETKLRKDETLDLLRKLEDQKAKYEATIEARGGILGKRSLEEALRPARPAEKRQKVRPAAPEVDTDSEDAWELENPEAFEEKGLEPVVPKAIAPLQTGNGLAQPLALDENGLPIIQSRKGKRRKKLQVDDPEELPWEGFASEIGDCEVCSEDEEDGETASSDETRSSLDEDETSQGENDSDNSTSETSDDAAADRKIKPRNSVFKSWATQQLNQSMGHNPSYSIEEGELLPAPKPALNPPAEKVKSVTSATLSEPVMNRKAHAVHVERSEKIQETRLQLPIIKHEQEIMEAIHNNPVVIIKGDTGSGKTTQIPQFLFEAGYGAPDGSTPGLIGITQPRRVAAISMAKRVRTELGQHGGKVSYQIRFDSTVSSGTAVKFMTDGILLRELSQDLLLRKYSVIVIDEAHERSVNTDLLIGMLSKIVPARMQKSKFNPDPKPLKLVIMSATLNIQELLHKKLFRTDMLPPIVEAEGRQHRVTTHFALRSRGDYIEEVVEKVKRAHRKLPRGGILVFLTGKMEINQVKDRLSTLPRPRNGTARRENSPPMAISASELPLEQDDIDLGVFKTNEEEDDFDLNILTTSEDEAEEHEFDISDDEDEIDCSEQVILGRPSPQASKEPYTSVHILPFHSQLPTSAQEKVFDSPPEGARLIVLATNVAETSLTIPGIRYVFDTGRSKERKYDLDSGVQSFEIDYISKASAQQRAGRAGRTSPGHCWRLYTSAVYEQFFREHAEPEILGIPAENVVLQLKGFGYPRSIAEFPFPTPPAPQTLIKAETLLKNLGALTSAGAITAMGKQFSNYPLPPRLGKILALGTAEPNRHLLPHILNLVSALAVGEIFISDAQLNLTSDLDADQDEINDTKQSHGRALAFLTQNEKSSDAMKLLTATSLYLSTPPHDREALCQKYFLRPKAMAEVSQLRDQLEHLVLSNYRGTLTSENLATPTKHSKLPSKTVDQLNTLAAAGYIDNLAIRYDLSSSPGAHEFAAKPRRAIDVPYIPLIPIHSSTSSSPLTETAIFAHPSSTLSRLSTTSLPEYITYTHLQRSQPSSLPITPSPSQTKTRFFLLTALSPTQILHLARDTPLLRYGKPLPKSKIEELPGTLKRRVCWVSCELKASGTVGLGWWLPPVKVRQVLDVKSREGWRVEEVLS